MDDTPRRTRRPFAPIGRHPPTLLLWPSAAKQTGEKRMCAATVAEGAGPAAEGTQRDPSAAGPRSPERTANRRCERSKKNVPANGAG